MTQEKVPATAEQGQAPAKNVEAAHAARSPEAQEVTAQAPKLAAGNHKEAPAAKPVPEAEAQAAAEAPAAPAEQFAYAAPAQQQAENVDGLAFQDDASTDDGGSGAGIILPILAVAAAGGGIALLAGGGNDPTDPPAPPPPPPPPPPANAAPVITSGDAADIDENSPVDTVVYTATATDANSDTITYSLTGEDAAAFNIDGATGEVTFKESPDFETDPSYSINVVASDGKGGTDTQAVTITVNDVDPETGGTPVDLDEIDDDNNEDTPVMFDAGEGDFAFSDGDDVGSTTSIANFGEGDTITIDGDTEFFVTTGGDEGQNLEITFNNEGVLSVIILEDVVPADAGFITDAESAEAELGFDFITNGEATDALASNDTSFG